MATTTPVLEGHTLKDPSEYTESVSYRGASVELADGTIKWDIVTSNSTTGVITNVVLNNPIEITDAGHGRSDNDIVRITGVVGTTELNGFTFVVDQISSSQFNLVGIDGTSGYSGYTSDGLWTLINDDKRTFSLQWRSLTTVQKNLLETAWAALRNSYNASNFTAPSGTTYTVTRAPGQEQLSFDTFISGGDLFWTTSVQLREA